jgi:uncharacterized protein (TIGR03083 family)
MSAAVEDFYREISGSTGTLASIVDGADLTQVVPTCPDWTLRKLATHVGRAHRWATEIVATRSATFLPFHEVPDGRLPEDPQRHADWLRDGAARLIGAVREAGSAPVWANGPDGDRQPASYWARRMAHETAVHRADGEITVGRVPVIDTVLAVDGIEEWLGFVHMAGGDDAGSRLQALAEGQVLHLHATDEGLTDAGEWMIRRDGGSIAVEHGHGKGDAAVRGPASALLLVLVRRLTPADAPVEVVGDRAVLDQWLAATPF